jgi:4-amino-4-deoxy-L-arabinose transferase
MLVSGDWVVPHLNGMRYFEKPPLGYWLNAAAMWLLGENAFAIRLSSALAAGLTAWLLLVWARRFSDDEAVPLLAAAVFLLSFEVFAVGTFCVLDSLLSLFVTAAMVAFYFACQQEAARSKVILLVLAGLACGLAFLTKGFLALVIPVLVIVPFSLWQGSFKLMLRTAWIALIPAVLVVLPWAIMIHRREPDFWHYFFWIEHVNRFLAADGGQHPEPFWFYVPMLLGGAMPWTPLAGPIVVGLRHSNWKHPMMRLALCWLALPFLFFSACSGKLGTYILPCFPPLAFLIAVGTLRSLRKGDLKGFARGAAVILVISGVCLLALLTGLILMPEMSQAVGLWKWSILAVGLLLWAVFSLASIHAQDLRRKLVLYSAGSVLFLFSWPIVSPAVLKTTKAPGAFLLANAARVCDTSVLVAENALTAATCWYYERDNIYILGRKGEYEYGLSYPDSAYRLLDVEGLKAIIAQQEEGDHVVLVTKARYYAELKKQLPAPSCEQIHGGIAWIEYVPTSSERSSGSSRSGVESATHEFSVRSGVLLVPAEEQFRLSNSKPNSDL